MENNTHRIVSWNVNGIRAAEKKGLFAWLKEHDPDVLCIQETKAQPDQLNESFYPEGYTVHFMSAEKKGYSGVAIYSKEAPLSIEKLGVEEFDAEGRTIIAHFTNYIIVNCYFPNSQAEGARLDYKTAFNNAILAKCDELVQAGKNIILCGDYNVAHKPIDLANPKRNEKNPGYLPEEREWMTTFIDAGYVDTFREFNKEPEQYTWWSYRMKAREKNIGWRIDYHCVNKSYMPKVKESIILPEVMGSDHCPVEITVEV